MEQVFSIGTVAGPNAAAKAGNFLGREKKVHPTGLQSIGGRGVGNRKYQTGAVPCMQARVH